MKAGFAVSPGSTRFDDFELRPEEASLLRRGLRLKLQPQPYRVLAYLIARSPAIVTREELGEHVWEKGVHVDLDQSLAYCIRQIRQVLGDQATRPRYVETLPRQGYRFVCPVEETPGVAMATPDVQDGRGLAEGTPVTHPRGQKGYDAGEIPPLADEGASFVRAGGRRWAAGLAASGALAVIALILVAVRHKVGGAPARVPQVKSLAVLPIENLSGDPGQEYVADGLTDELTTMLAKDSSLRIVSRTSVMQYKEAHRPLREVARALGADAVVEGSFARTGTRTHITLQLIRADSDSHLWAESYDREADDGTVAGEAAQSIAKRLNSAVRSAKAARFIAPAAHDAYLRGRYLWPTVRAAESGAYFKKAIEIQPDYAEAWAGLSNYYGEGIAGDFLDPRTSIPLEEEAAKRALALAPEMALAHQAMAGAYLVDRWDWENADREILLAISMDPSDAESYYLRANVLEAMNRFPDSIRVEKKAMEMEPFERPDALASFYLGARRYDEALAEIRLRKEAAPNSPGLLFTEKEVWRCKGKYREAMEAWARYHEVTGDPKAAAEVRRAYEVGGARGFIRWELQRRLLEAKHQYVSPVELASYYAQLGDKEHALPLIEEGYRQRSTDFLWIPDDPAFDFLHSNLRYRAVLGKVERPPVR